MVSFEGEGVRSDTPIPFCFLRTCHRPLFSSLHYLCVCVSVCAVPAVGEGCLLFRFVLFLTLSLSNSSDYQLIFAFFFAFLSFFITPTNPSFTETVTFFCSYSQLSFFSLFLRLIWCCFSARCVGVIRFPSHTHTHTSVKQQHNGEGDRVL